MRLNLIKKEKQNKFHFETVDLTAAFTVCKLGLFEEYAAYLLPVNIDCIRFLKKPCIATRTKNDAVIEAICRLPYLFLCLPVVYCFRRLPCSYRGGGRKGYRMHSQSFFGRAS